MERKRLGIPSLMKAAKEQASKKAARKATGKKQQDDSKQTEYNKVEKSEGGE